MGVVGGWSGNRSLFRLCFACQICLLSVNYVLICGLNIFLPAVASDLCSVSVGCD